MGIRTYTARLLHQVTTGKCKPGLLIFLTQRPYQVGCMQITGCLASYQIILHFQTTYLKISITRATSIVAYITPLAD